MLENYSIRVFAKHYWAILFYAVPSSKNVGGVDYTIMFAALCLMKKQQNSG